MIIRHDDNQVEYGPSVETVYSFERYKKQKLLLAREDTGSVQNLPPYLRLLMYNFFVFCYLIRDTIRDTTTTGTGTGIHDSIVYRYGTRYLQRT